MCAIKYTAIQKWNDYVYVAAYSKETSFVLD